MKTYTVWFYDINRKGQLERAHDVFSGTRYQCYKIKYSKTFSWQYKVEKNKER